MKKWKIFFFLLSFTLFGNNNISAKTPNNQPAYLIVLDFNNSFEDSLLAAYNSIPDKDKPILLEKCSTNNAFVTEYRLIPKDVSTDRLSSNYTDLKEEYILRLFKSSSINIGDIQVKIDEYPIYNNFCYSYLHTTITNKNNNSDTKECMLPILNIDRKKLFQNNYKNQERIIQSNDKLEETTQNIATMFKLLDIAGCVTRQLNEQDNLAHSGILKCFVEQGIFLLEIPDDTLFNTMLHDQNHNMYKILTYLYDITTILEYLHEQDIAHGDVCLTNLFTLKGKVVLSGFEHFRTLFINDDNKGSKRFVFHSKNGNYSAPEIIDPVNENAYKQATLASDIYSLGILFTEILYVFTSGKFYLNDIDVNYDPFCGLETYKRELVCFNRHPYKLIEKVKYFIPVLGPRSLYLYNLKNILGYYFKSQQEDCVEVIKKLTEIINHCTKEKPQNRLDATEIKKRIADLISQYYRYDF